MENLIRLNLPIAGMTCASCVARVERALAAVPELREEYRRDEGVKRLFDPTP